MSAQSTFDPPNSAVAAPAERWLAARVPQVFGVIAAVTLVAALHASGDGLWFQGDAPRHAMNGVFWWDLLRAMPVHPLTFALRYFARYPVISPATYPPLFYVIEGAAFQVFGTSPFVVKTLIAACSVMTGVYVMAWARRWIGPRAGWAGAFVAFVPAMVLWTNTVMLNVPATALGMASLYHVRRWLESDERRHLLVTIVFLAALILTYYQGVLVAPICVLWALAAPKDVQRRRRRLMWVGIAAVAAVVPIALAAYLAPVQFARHAPGIHSFMRLRTWTLYPGLLPQIVGVVLLTAGVAGFALAWRVPRLRTEVAFVASWIVVLMVCVSPLPAKDARYILLVAPAFVLAATLGVAAVFEGSTLRPGWQAALLVGTFALSFWSATRVVVPDVSGFREVAEFTRREAPSDAVLYDGRYDGVFGFYARAMDPLFERRLVRGDKLLYDYGPTTTFRRVEITHVNTTDDVVDIVEHRCGCPWIAVEMGPEAPERMLRAPQRVLREALRRPEFALVRSFAVHAEGVDRVDVFKVVAPVQNVETVDLVFPAFTTRVFSNVAPITR
jgi:hypothetical protein